MAAEVSSMPGVNGYAPHQGYGGIEQQQQHNTNAYAANTATSQAAHAPSAPAAAGPAGAAANPQQGDIPKDEVGWYFVEQYYTTLSRSPEKLYLFYNKRSQFVSGQETDKVAVCVGQRAINDRIKELDFHDAKVRVTNVDSQASDLNIVIQVIGEISNKSEAPKKFTQTFVLATQTNGYFVLNDIFRYLVEEEEEVPESEAAPVAQVEEIQQAPAAESEDQEPPPTMEQAEPKTLTSSLDPSAVEHDAHEIDKELEEKVLKDTEAEEPVEAKVNGVAESSQAESNHVEPAPAAAAPEQEEAKVEEPASDVALETEKPKDPTPSPAPAPAQQAPSAPTAPVKPAVPKTWASLAASAARTGLSPAPAAPVQSQQRQAPTNAKPTQTTPAAQPTVPTGPAVQREETPASPSQDEWNTVSNSHNRQQSRQGNSQQQQQEQGPQSRGYIKNVHEGVKSDELKSHLSQYGEVTYFDIARQKNCAFVDYKSPDGYNAAVAANPHQIGQDKFYVEERRTRPQGNGPFQRGGFQSRGGRGGMQGGPRGSFQGGPRGGFAGRGSRGGAAPSPGAGRGRGAAQE